MKWVCAFLNIGLGIVLFVNGLQNNGGENYFWSNQFVGGALVLLAGFIWLYLAVSNQRYRAKLARQRAEREAVASEEAEIKKFLDSSG